MLPPGPTGLAKIKTCLGFFSDPLGLLTRLAQEYGDMVYLGVPGMKFFLLNDPRDIETVLRHRAECFKKDWYLQANRMLFGEGLLTSEGELWRRQRKLAQPAFQLQRVQSYADAMVRATRKMLDCWQLEEERDIHADLMRLTLDIVGQTLFGTDMERFREEIEASVLTLSNYFASPASASATWQRVPTPGVLRYRRAVRRLDAVIAQLIERRRADGAGGNDFLSRLMAATDDSGRQMSDQQLRDEAITFILAGHETTALALTFTFRLLGENRDVERKLANEVATVLDGRGPTAADVLRLPYAAWVVKESMRLYPPVWSVGREAINDIEVGGYRIPRKAQVVMAQWVVHRDQRFFDDPLTFRPERWGDARMESLPRCAYFPFGDGPRICIGNQFAMMEAVLILATVVQRYRLELVPGQRIALLPSITLRPKSGIRIVVRHPTEVSAVQAGVTA
jgi:cytochrome P450